MVSLMPSIWIWAAGGIMPGTARGTRSGNCTRRGITIAPTGLRFTGKFSGIEKVYLIIKYNIMEQEENVKIHWDEDNPGRLDLEYYESVC